MRLYALAAAVLLAACAPAAETAHGQALITVFHPAGEDAPESGLFEKFALTGAATGFTAADLAAAPASEITTGYPLGADAQSWTGPRLSALLAEIDAPGASARLTSLDGYQVEVTAEEIDAHEPVLATHRDGAPLSLGGLGPAILIWPRDTAPELADMNDDQWPWAVFAVEILEPGDG